MYVGVYVGNKLSVIVYFGKCVVNLRSYIEKIIFNRVIMVGKYYWLIGLRIFVIYFYIIWM